MKLKLYLKEKKNTLCLIDGGKIVSQSVWKEENNMSQKLLPEIDKIIKRNKLKLSRIKKIEVKNNIPASFTTVRIAKTAAKIFNYAVKFLDI